MDAKSMLGIAVHGFTIAHGAGAVRPIRVSSIAGTSALTELRGFD